MGPTYAAVTRPQPGPAQTGDQRQQPLLTGRRQTGGTIDCEQRVVGTLLQLARQRQGLPQERTPCRMRHSLRKDQRHVGFVQQNAVGLVKQHHAQAAHHVSSVGNLHNHVVAGHSRANFNRVFDARAACGRKRQGQARSRADVALLDQSVLRLNANTTIRIEAPKQGKTGVLDYVFERYLDEAEPQGISFIDWVQSDAYDPVKIKAAFHESWWGNLLTEKLLRRE